MKIKQNMHQILFPLLTLLWMGVIFSFSVQTSGESSGVSGNLCRLLLEGINGLFRLGWQEEQIAQYIELLQFPVRKAAHMTEYAILAWLAYGSFASFSFSRKKSFLCALALSFLYACSDEIHQLFVSGRAGQVRDVLIDTTGALLGLLALQLIISAIIKFKNNKQKKVEVNS